MATNISFLQARIDTVHANYANGGMTAPERDAALLDIRVHTHDVRLGGGDVNAAAFQSLVIQSKAKAKKV